MLTTPPLSLYLHMPWCVQKCPYCDFNSHQDHQADFDRYLKALQEDICLDAPMVKDRTISTVFIGGGTPSLMPVEFYQQLFATLQEQLSFSDDCEITIEANPGASDAERFAGYVELGMNRLSIGAQSFDAGQLQQLGRIHDPQAIFRSYQQARQAGFKRINLDLMFGLNEQSQAQALDDLRQALTLKPEHLSWYQLTIEPNTIFGKRPPKSLPEHDALDDIYQAGLEQLSAAGYEQYEVSAHANMNAPSSERCRHNVNYWRFGDYLALGAGAHGKLTFVNKQQIWRYQKTRSPKDYMQRIGSRTSQHRDLDHQARFEEFFLNSLRLKDQLITAQDYRQRTGLELNEIISAINRHPWLGEFFHLESQQLRLLEAGYQRLDSVLTTLYETQANQ
ncbi:MAG: radical SAM family heme chaperone HemW [Pseudomonadota bacterium]|nr:radical SAM family heme chaperone HemW [Pseudomonadota bacterium]